VAILWNFGFNELEPIVLEVRMVTRPGNPSEAANAGDKATPPNASSDTQTQPFQAESPFQSSDGLSQLRDANRINGSVILASVPDVSWSATVEKAGDAQRVPMESGAGKADSQPKSVGDQLTSMILANGNGPGRNLEQLRDSNPKLAAEIQKAVEALTRGSSPEAAAETLRIMGELYKGFDPRPTDNRESKQELIRAKRDPEMVLGVLEKTREIMRMNPEKRPNAIKKLQIDVRTFHLDGGNL
jgi:hypothetical protein